MVQILIITNKGKFEAKPFSVNDPEAMTSEDLIESIPVGTMEQNQVDQGDPSVSEETVDPSDETSD